LAALPVLTAAQTAGGLDPATLLKPLADNWPTYSGDYTGRRFSSQNQINRSTVKNLTLSWVARLNGTAGSPQTILGGVGAGEYTNVTVKGFVLYFDETLYVTSADHVWAMDARDGRLLWHYFWRTRGGTHTGNRGVALWHNYLFFETPDDYLVSLEAKTGKERWHIEIADFDQQYFSTMAPVVVGDHLLVGTGNDLDAPGFLQSYDPETGKLQWKFITVPIMPVIRPRNLAKPRCRAARRRTSLDTGIVRSRDKALHLWNREPYTRIHGSRPQGRQPVHMLTDCRERRNR
jgi:alcohol dehydrogenase (cytochrome c)